MSKNLSESRKDKRYTLPGTFVINENGVCQVLDLSSGGLSFGCVNERQLPQQLTVDIVNSRGVHIWDLPVETVWLRKCDKTGQPSIHTFIVGARFCTNMSSEQKTAIDDLITSLQ